MLLKNKQVAIIGGGPGGLTLARLLQLEAVNVKVYERDVNRHARVQGSPLDLHDESGLAAIRKANLLEEFKNNFRPGADKKRIMNEQAEIFFSDHDTKAEENFGNAWFRPEIDRGPLRNILLESLHPGTVTWDSHFISMELQNDGWLLHFKNGSSYFADVVIAADGANSKIRSYITTSKPFYTGVTMLEGVIYNSNETAPAIHQLLNGGKIMAFGDSRCLLMGSKGNTDAGFYASFKTNENWAKNSGIDYSDRSQLLTWFKEEYDGWSPVWNELFETVSMPMIPRPIYCSPLNQTWTALPNLTMIGDAAHVMPPFAGEGANMAMLDALELTECLTAGGYKTLQEAMTAFENRMRERAAIAAKESLENGELMHSEGSLTALLNLFNAHHVPQQ